MNTAPKFAYYFHRVLLIVIFLTYIWIPITNYLGVENSWTTTIEILSPRGSIYFGISISLLFWVTDFTVQFDSGLKKTYINNAFYMALSMATNALAEYFFWYKETGNTNNILLGIIFSVFSLSLFIIYSIDLFKNPPKHLLEPLE